jgi:hypothetical protein
MKRALLLLLLWPLGLFAQNSWQGTGHFKTNTQARLGAIPTPTPGYDHWTAGAYTVALWDAQELASGNWTDSVNSIVLTKTGSPTYGVYGSEDYSGWKGVTVGTGNYFAKTTATTALDRGATDHAVIQMVLRASTLSGYEVPFSTVNAGGYLMSYHFHYNSALHTAAWMSDGTHAVGGDFTRSSAAVTGTMYKIRIVCQNGANITVYENGEAVGTPLSMATVVAITNTGIGIGASSVGQYPFIGDVFAVKVDKGTDAAVLSVNDGGPGGG